MDNNASMEDHWSDNPRFTCKHNWHFVHGTSTLKCERCGQETGPRTPEQLEQELMQDTLTKVLIDEATVRLVLEALESLVFNKPFNHRYGDVITALKGLATLPAQQEPESECNPQDLCAGCRCKYAAQPAQRTWVELTDEEKRQIFEREDYQGWLDYINAIEAKLKEKNT